MHGTSCSDGRSCNCIRLAHALFVGSCWNTYWSDVNIIVNTILYVVGLGNISKVKEKSLLHNFIL